MNYVNSNSISKCWSMMFIIAAAVNIIGAVWLLLNPENSGLLMYGSKIVFDNSAARINNQAFLFFVIVFGIGYIFVAKNPSENRGIVWLGIIGKLYYFTAWGFHFKSGLVTPAAFAGSFVDLAFAILFILFLYKTRESSR
ncbi:MAG: hypothetical protein HN737_02050 [Desulfobacterales bacterium]|jgi:hypothetical protein|nr:hypothetical protein [Desulfobacteraceae bacterium]MBT4364938.1 hypothetical protein [Desulfobacteraceae bacterium]MBT7085729.1 hypothetical protein [Desulfobacterales bacterium]MBT7696172.1 hypothetical protein [Desulfobacterales bacterium]